jgi:hypothetical protein
MEQPVLWISVLIIGVAIGGIFILSDMPTPTGNVVAECGCTAGDTVCAAIGHKLYDYPSACHARCDGLHIVAESACLTIPTEK